MYAPSRGGMTNKVCTWRGIWSTQLTLVIHRCYQTVRIAGTNRQSTHDGHRTPHRHNGYQKKHIGTCTNWYHTKVFILTTVFDWAFWKYHCITAFDCIHNGRWHLFLGLVVCSAVFNDLLDDGECFFVVVFVRITSFVSQRMSDTTGRFHCDKRRENTTEKWKIQSETSDLLSGVLVCP